VTALPALGAGLNDSVVPSVHIPAEAGRGPMILRRLLFALGARSARLMRGYFGTASYSDRYGKHGGQSLRPTKPANWKRPDGKRILRQDDDPALRMLPALYAEDRRRMVYGPDGPDLSGSGVRMRTQRADAALEKLAEAGVIDLRRGADGGWRILRADLDKPADWTPDPKLLKP